MVAGDAGDVADDVDAAERIDAFGHRSGDVGDVGDIKPAGCDRPLEVVGELGGLSEAIGVDVDREHGGALGGETDGCRSTDAAGGAGQKCDAVGEAAHRGRWYRSAGKWAIR